MKYYLQAAVGILFIWVVATWLGYSIRVSVCRDACCVGELCQDEDENYDLDVERDEFQHDEEEDLAA